LFAALFAMLLGLRLLSPVGFMPSFEHGTVTIVACPDAGFAPAHHDHDKPKAGQPCPYAAVPALGALATLAFAILLVAIFAVAWLVTATAQRPSIPCRLRPPATGPPLLS
jgi:hypothetical protein